MEAAKRVAMNTGFLYARMGITVFISLYSTRLVLAALGETDYGIFNVVGGAIAMLTFLNIAMTTATQRFMSYAQGEKDEEKQKYIFNVSIMLHIGIAILVVALLEVAAYFLFNGILEIPRDRIPVAKIVYQITLISTFFMVISVPYDAVINAHENMLFVAVLGIFEAVIKLAIAYYITFTVHDKLKMYGVLMVALPVFILLVRSIYCHRKYAEVILNPRKYFNKNLLKEMTSFAGWSLLDSSASIISMQGISILINSFFGVVVNAAQGITNQVSGQLMAFSTTMLKALNPVIVKSEGEKNRGNMLKASLTGNKISFFLMAILSIPVIIEMPTIFKFWLKDVPEYAIVFCQLNLVRSMLSQLTITFPTAIGATGKIKQFSFWNSIIFVLLLPASYIAFKFGAPPPAIYVNLLLMSMGLSACRIYYTHKICNLDVNDFLKNVFLKSILTAALIYIVGSLPSLFLDEGLFRVILTIGVSGVSSLIIIFSVGLNEKERELIKNGISAILRKIRKKSAQSITH